MKYLKLFSSHRAYEAEDIKDFPCVVYDGQEVHYLKETSEDEDEEPTDTTTIVE